MQKKLIMLACLLITLSWAGLAKADLIVDTGVPASSPNWQLNTGEWLAGEFNTGDYNSITRAEGYIWQFAEGQGEIRVVIYTDGGDVPGTPVGSKGFLANPSGQSIGWFGADFDSPLAVATNTDYWVAFEVGDESSFNGAMPGSAPHPLANEAINLLPGGYLTRDDIDINVRVYGNPVPLPGTLWLLGTGLLGLASLGWRRRRAVV